MLLDGKPVAGADVTFIRDGAARFSAGRTDSKGAYTLSTYEQGDGAVVGANVVTVTMPAIADDGSATLPDSPLSEEYYGLLKESQNRATKQQIPARYADPTTSGLSVEVTEGGIRHDILLQSDLE